MSRSELQFIRRRRQAGVRERQRPVVKKLPTTQQLEATAFAQANTE